MKRSWISLAIAGALGVAPGCALKRVPPDDYSLLNKDLEYQLSSLPQNGEASNIPWAGSCWPTYQDNINYRWDGPNSKSPAFKYGTAFGVTNVEDAVSRNHGIDSRSTATACSSNDDCDSSLGESCAKRTGNSEGRCIPTWFGICHAWAPVSILMPEPRHAVTHNGVTFKVNDIKALLTLTYNRTHTKFHLLSCNLGKNSNEVAQEAYGRPTDGNRECRQANPAVFHVVLSNYLGIQRHSIVVDHTVDAEVWNQPVRGYRIIAQDEVSASEANRLIGMTGDGSSIQADYQFSPNAAKLFHVKTDIDYISESPSSVDGKLTDDIDTYTRTTRYEYILEIDANGKLVGGEWLGSSKAIHPDFLWLPTGLRDTSVAGGTITSADVMRIYQLSLGEGDGRE